jgi:hypothetical protein
MNEKDKKPFNETKFGKFLNKAKNVVPDVLTVAGKVATGNIGGAIEEVSNVLNKKAKDDIEAAYLRDEFEKYKMEYEKELYLIQEENVTKRWQSDNEQDLKLPKLIRPLTLATLVGLFVLTVVLSYFNVIIPDKYLSVLEMILLTVIGAYFGARSVDKFTKIKK